MLRLGGFGRDTSALLTSNLATSLGLQSIQGYNAVHIARYYEYIEALNGRSQGYHDTDVVPQGLDSPLLDLLNVRYVVVPAVVQPDQSVLRELKDAHPTVYSDDRVEVLENRNALPRAWIVHSAKKSPPDLARPTEDASADQAVVNTYEADRIGLKTATGASGLLMLSEVYYPVWKAYVDGERVPLYRADHLIRLRDALSDESYAGLLGTTDSETIFAGLLDRLRENSTDLGGAITETIQHVSGICVKLGVRATLNLAVTDGKTMSFARHSTEGPGNSLYFVEDGMAFAGAVVVASERLDGDPRWREVPDRHLLTVDGDGASLRTL